MSERIDLIDLKPYLHPAARAMILELYALHRWDFLTDSAWEWPFADVCALYFRCARHANTFGPEGVSVLKGIVSAIQDYMEDEFT